MIGLAIFTGSVLFLALVVVFRRSAFIEAPIAVALLSLAWVVPQGLRIYDNGVFTEAAQNYFWIWAAGCVLVFWLGFRWANRPAAVAEEKRETQHHHYWEARLQLFALVLVIVGAVSLRVAAALAIDLGSQWTGPATFFFMLGQFLNWGFCLIMLLVVRNPSKANLFILLIAAALILFQMTGYVKRNAVFEIACIVAGSLYFVRRWTPSLPLLAVALVLGAVLIHEVSSIRHYVKTHNVTTYEAVLSGAPFQSFQEEDAVSTTELSQAIFDVEMVNTTGRLDYGASFWDKFVHRWVPGFIVGPEVKEALKFQARGSEDSVEILSFSGATRTGFSDAYSAFAVFGLGIFLVIGLVVGRFYRKASTGDIFGQYLYLIILNDALVAFTEATSRFLVNLPWTLGVGILIFALARNRDVGKLPAHGFTSGRYREPVPDQTPVERLA